MKTVLQSCLLLFCLLYTTPTAAEAPRSSLSVAAAGDIMMGTTHPKNLLPPNDGKGIFDEVKSALQDHDLVFGNLEGPLLDGGKTTKCERYNYCFAFRTPTRYAAYLRQAGFMAMGVANNHASDFGEEGRMSTLRTLYGAGIQPVGGVAVARFYVKGKRIAVAGFSYSTSTLYSFNILNIPRAKRIIRELKAENDIVIVSFHGGSEGRKYQHVPRRPEIFMEEKRGDVMRFSRSVVDAGADMVIGHGPHVLRAMEVYQGKLIAYSLGNFLTYARFNLKGANGISAVLNARIDAETGEFIDGMVVPVKLVGEGIPVPDPERRAITIIRTLSRQDFPESKLVISDDGVLRREGKGAQQGDKN
ncbi:MAG TPA: capsule biosynthesis protein CapA [Nitrospiraceae bacterium]|nr:capsule biosynthesis protein CapA [Nitrospiraceae bacterium]